MNATSTGRNVVLSLLGLGTLCSLLGSGCGATSTPDRNDASPTSSSGGGSSGTDASAACSTDLDCNGDLEVSSFQGECHLGICVCRDPFVVQPSGKCAAMPAPDCMVQGGRCTQEPATCPSGQLTSTSLVNRSCGDLVAAVCCFDLAECKGPSFRCVVPDETLGDALCVNGWRTCAAGARPMASDDP